MHYWVYSWQVVTFVLTRLDSMRIEHTAYTFTTLMTMRNIHRLPPGCTHFRPFSIHYPGTFSTESCRACSYNNRTSDTAPFVSPHRVSSYSKRYKYSRIYSYTRMANNKLTLHRSDYEPRNIYSTKPKWNAYSTEILLCRIPKMLTVTPVPSATRGSVMKGKSECKGDSL